MSLLFLLGALNQSIGRLLMLRSAWLMVRASDFLTDCCAMFIVLDFKDVLLRIGGHLGRRGPAAAKTIMGHLCEKKKWRGKKVLGVGVWVVGVD